MTLKGKCSLEMGIWYICEIHRKKDTHRYTYTHTNTQSGTYTQ